MIVKQIKSFFEVKNWNIFKYQKDVWKKYEEGYSGLISAPTGYGKTLAGFFAFFNNYLIKGNINKSKSIKILWITPIKSLANDTQKSIEKVVKNFNIDFKVDVRTGDLSYSRKETQLKNLPDLLITTPESLHLIFTNQNYEKFFEDLECIIVDEWHELVESKRGVLVQLAISRLLSINPMIRTWGISATFIDPLKSLNILLPKTVKKKLIVQSNENKDMSINLVLPEKLEKFSWSGHLGFQLSKKVFQIINRHNSTLVFVTTRSQAELWYRKLIDIDSELIGNIGIHHGSIDKKIREWVENSLKFGKLKVVVCTSSFDLGLDFDNVDCVIQIGSPKNFSKFIQRAGRSNHKPGKSSKIYFVPTNSLEIIDGFVLKKLKNNLSTQSIEISTLYLDILMQYLLTLSIAQSFSAEKIFKEIKKTFIYSKLSKNEFDWIIDFLINGGNTLKAYDEYKKLIKIDSDKYKVANKRIASKHKLSIGTIVSENLLDIKFSRGKKIGKLDEKFINNLSKNDSFWFGGKLLEIVMIKYDTVYVKLSNKKLGKVPKWLGNRLPLSSDFSILLRQELSNLNSKNEENILSPLISLQKKWSALPTEENFVIECIKSNQGFHKIFYILENRKVNEAIASLIAFRVTKKIKISFTISVNEYGFELFSDQDFSIEQFISSGLLNKKNLLQDLVESINLTQMAKNKFGEIAKISGLIFQGYPGRKTNSKHLSASTELLFNLFKEYDPSNLLYRQSFEEVKNEYIFDSQLEKTIDRISKQKIYITYPKNFTPFAFPLIIERLRLKLSSESLIDRIKKMQEKLEKLSDDESK